MAELELDMLESKGLIRLAAIDPELEYLFRHALVQDAAYESLLKQERRLLHRQVGEALESLYPERHGELAAVLARHFEQAGDPDKAVEYLLEAARYANERYALREAYDLFGRAQALLPAPSDDDPPELRRRRLEIEFGRVRNSFSFLGDEEQFAALAPLISEAERLGDLRLVADIRLHDALLRMFSGQRPQTSPELAASLDRVRDIAEQLGDPVISALPTSVIGLFQVFGGELREGVAMLEQAAPLLEQKHDFVGSSFALMALGMGLARLGRFDEAQRVSDRSMEVAKEGDIIARIDAMIGKSAVDAIRGDFEAAVPAAMECTQLAEESGATACVVSSSYLAGEALMQQQRYKDAQAAFERSISISDLTNERMFRPLVNASLHSVAASLGVPPLAGHSLEEALSDARERHDRWAETTVIWRRGETALKTPDGDREQALADYAEAVEGFREMGARPYEARALRDWGLGLLTLGRTEEGNEKLRAALTILGELGLNREASDVREALKAA